MRPIYKARNTTMFSTALQPIEHYRQIDTVTAVSQANPHQLVVLLFDGAIAAILQARHAIATGDFETKRITLSKAMRIVDEGLKASLVTEGDPSLSNNLSALYDYMVSRLLTASVHNLDEPLAEVAGLLGDLRTTWAEIAPASVKRADLQA